MVASDAVAKARAFEAAGRRTAEAVRDPDAIPPSEAVQLYELVDRAGRAAAAAKVLLAKRVAASGEWRRQGYRTPAEYLAKVSGGSLGGAKDELTTSEVLDGLPATKGALVQGEVSQDQGRIVAGAAAANPGAEHSLLEAAHTANHIELRDQAQKAKAAADPDLAATHRRIHAARRAGRFTDGEGAWNLRARGTVADGSVVSSELDRLTDDIFRGRGKAGTTECRDAYTFDALVEMARRSEQLRHGSPTDSAGRRRQPPPQHLALLRLDVSALKRGHVEGDELCEIAGLGPVPVESARRLLGDAVLKLVLTNGVDVAHVTSLTRGPTQAMRYALLWSSPTCTVEGCTRTIVEYDHVNGHEYARTRHTRLDQLAPVCPGHHDLHTLHGWALVVGSGKRPMVPPDDPRHPNNARAGPTPPDDDLERARADTATTAVRALEQQLALVPP